MKKLIIAFLMATIAISLYPLANATEGDSGYFGSTATAGGGFVQTATDTFYCSPFALNVDANITGLHGYGDWYNQNIKFFIYSNDGATCYYGGDSVKVTGNVWLNDSAVDIQLQAGTYLLGFRSSGTANYVYKTTGNGMSGSVGFAAAWGSLSPTFNTNLYSIYANYTEATYIGAEEVTAQMISTDWLTFSALMALSLISLILAWKSNVPIINFVFGVVTLGTAAYYLGANIVFAGWINILAILMASLCMLSGAIKLRET